MPYYKDIPGKPGWQFRDDSPDPGGNQSALWNKQSSGIRTRGLTQIYTETKRTSDPDGFNRGELSATYVNKEVKPISFFRKLPLPGVPTDPLWDNVAVLMRPEGGSSINRGYAEIENSTHIINPSEVNGNKSYSGQIQFKPVFVGPQDFCVEGYVVVNFTPTPPGMARIFDMRKDPADVNGLNIIKQSSSMLLRRGESNIETAPMSGNAFFNFKFIRKGIDYEFYLNGTRYGQGVDSIDYGNTIFSFGKFLGSTNYPTGGPYNQLRITVGNSRYTFPSATTPLTDIIEYQ